MKKIFFKKEFKRATGWILSGEMILSILLSAFTVSTPVQAAEGSRQYYKDGKVVQASENYDGYVEISKQNNQVTFTPVAAEGYEFSILNLSSNESDNHGKLYTPLSRDYVKDSSEYNGNRLLEEGETPSYTITVEEEGSYENGSSYTTMPEVTAYFDSANNVLNDTLLSNGYSNEGNDKILEGWLSGKISAGTEKWSGTDTDKVKESAVFDAGEGNEFAVTGAVFYGRLQWPDRFDGITLEVSSDGVNWETITQQTPKDTSSNKYYTPRYEEMLNEAKKGRYLRIFSLWPTKDISRLQIYGSVVDETPEQEVDAEISYQLYKDGVLVETVLDLNSATKAYDGYVKFLKQGTAVTVIPVANEGYDFMMLNLKDTNGNVTTPLSKDYVKSGLGNQMVTDEPKYKFTVDETKDTLTESETIGTVYNNMPEITAYFDIQGDLINDELLNLTPMYSQQENKDKSLTCWLDTATATLNAGVDYWDGKDIANGDYVTYYAGEGKAFCLSQLAIYSRRGWSDTRFTVVIEGSNDGDNFETIFSTKNTDANQRYSIARQTLKKDLKYRIIRINATGKNTDVNLFKLYGTVDEVADEDLSYGEWEEENIVLPEITDYVVNIKGITSDAGFIHPGVGVTKDVLENVREQIKNKQEPWYSYYKVMANTTYASKGFSCDNSLDGVTPQNDAYDSRGIKNRAENDGKRAYTQALMYVITGDEIYRSNSIRIIRIWQKMDPDKYKYFEDAHIHTGMGLYYMIQAAEILKYTSCETKELEWTDEDNEKFITNVVNPSTATFMNFNDKFMNQHNFPLYGTLAAAIFKDDMEDYKEKVEWTTVNEEAPVKEYTGSIKYLFRLITQNDATGEALSEDDQYIQHVEMGRDLAHAGDDNGNLISLARMIQAQNTLLDPVDGTVSENSNAVNIYEFLDNRILTATDYFCQFDMGYDVKWTPVITEPANGDYPAKYYPIVSDQYQGRQYSITNLPELYYVYRYQLDYSDTQLEEEAPYYMKAVEERPGPVFYASGSGENTDVSAVITDDWWIYIPEEVLQDDNELANTVPESTSQSRKYYYEFENNYSIIDGSNQVIKSNDNICKKSDADVSYLSTKASDNDTLFALYNITLINRKNEATVGLRIRTNGNAKLEIKKEANKEPFYTLQLPDTKGEWKNITFDMGYDSVTSGQYSALTFLMYFNVIGDGTQVDFDSININAAKTLSAPKFNNISENTMNAVISLGDKFTFDFSASDSNVLHNNSLTYMLQGDNLPGVDFNTATGEFSWEPKESSATGTYDCYVVASDGYSYSSINAKITVVENREKALETVCSSYNSDESYVALTVDDYLAARQEVLNGIETDSAEEFYKKINLCIEAVNSLQQLNPVLADGSLNYPEIIAATSLDEGIIPSLIDNNPVTFTGDLFTKYFTIDFGAFYKVKATKLQVQPRNIWANRMAGCVIMGSNDGENWVTLTEEAPYSDNLETLEVKEEYQDMEFRYLKASTLSSDTSNIYAAKESILSIGELRIYGIRTQEETNIREISISSNAETLRQHEGNGKYPQIFPECAVAGDEIYLDIRTRTKAENLSVTIAGLNADIETISDLKYRAKVTLTEEAALYNAARNAEISVSDDKCENSVKFTTDGSSVFVSSSENEIKPMEMDNVVLYSHATNAEENAANAEDMKELWDNNTITFTDTTNSGSGKGVYYGFDFGENNRVSLERVEIMARPDFLGRSTGIHLQGSNDYDIVNQTGTWETITSSTITTIKWQGLRVNNDKAYRYIRIANDGIWYGNMSELRLYGSIVDKVEVSDKLALQELVDKILEMDSTKYTSESWGNLEILLVEANKVLQNENSTQESIDEMVESLKASINDLEEVIEQVDKSALQELVKKLSKIDLSKYTSESWTIFKVAFDNAQLILNNENATQLEVNSALAILEKAKGSLVKIKGEDDTDIGTVNNGGNSSNSGEKEELPKTGGVPGSIISLLGLVIVGTGLQLSKKNKKLS